MYRLPRFEMMEYEMGGRKKQGKRSVKRTD